MTQKTYQNFLGWLEEARKCAEDATRADVKYDKNGRKYPAGSIKMNKGADDKEEVKEEVEDIEEGQKVKTSTGYIHKGTYGSEYDTDEEGNEKKKEAPAVKRGRGRPKKGSDETGNVKKYTFHPALAKFGNRSK